MNIKELLRQRFYFTKFDENDEENYEYDISVIINDNSINYELEIDYNGDFETFKIINFSGIEDLLKATNLDYIFENEIEDDCGNLLNVDFIDDIFFKQILRTSFNDDFKCYIFENCINEKTLFYKDWLSNEALDLFKNQEDFDYEKYDRLYHLSIIEDYEKFIVEREEVEE